MCDETQYSLLSFPYHFFCFEFDMAEKKLFMQALSVAGPQTALLPLNPDSGKGLARYGLLRVKWLATLCLLHLGRQQEAAAGIRFMRQYHIEIQ